MVPAAFAISPNAASHFVSNDKVLTIDVPAGSISDADKAADGGKTSLLVRQVNPASGSSAGGSGHVSFGTFLVQVVDASGHLSGHGLHLPLKFTLTYGKGTAVDLAHAYSVINGPIPSWVNLDPSSVLAPSSSPSISPTGSGGRGAVISSTAKLQSSFGPLSTAPVSVDAPSRSLIGRFALSGSSGAYSWGTFSSVATFGKPDPTEVQLSSGALTTSYPIDVPKGPGGFTPPLALAYSSAGVSDQHNAQGAATWVGEGWNMSLGAISWAEHNVRWKGDLSASWTACHGNSSSCILTMGVSSSTRTWCAIGKRKW